MIFHVYVILIVRGMMIPTNISLEKGAKAYEEKENLCLYFVTAAVVMT